MSRSTLKSFFETGKRPTEAEFAQMIDELQHKQEEPDHFSVHLGTSTALSAGVWTEISRFIWPNKPAGITPEMRLGYKLATTDATKIRIKVSGAFFSSYEKLDLDRVTPSVATIPQVSAGYLAQGTYALLVVEAYCSVAQTLNIYDINIKMT